MIWTTTAWTIPANQALNLNPTLEYALVDTERGLLVLAAALVEKCLVRYGLQGTVLATTLGEKLGGIHFRHPLAHVDAGYDRLSPVYLADYATADDGTGIVHSLAGLRPGRLQLLRRARHDVRRHPEPGAGQRRLRGRLPAVRRPEHLEGRAGDHRGAEERRAACSPPRPSRTATRTAGATRRR